MQSKKFTPLEILHKQKIGLQKKSAVLAESIENHARYLQENFAPLLRSSVVKSAVSKLPAQLQNFAGSFRQKEQKIGVQNPATHKIAREIAIGIAEIAPFFLKGKKGMFISIVLKHIIKRVVR